MARIYTPGTPSKQENKRILYIQSKKTNKKTTANARKDAALHTSVGSEDERATYVDRYVISVNAIYLSKIIL